MPLDIRLLEAFRSVMENQSVTGAARVLGLTQPAVSAQIARLEAQLGFELFERAGGRLCASESGRRFYREVRTVLSGVERLSDVARGIRSGAGEAVSVASHPGASVAIMPRVMAALRRQRPDARLRLISRNSEEVLSIFTSGAAEIGIAEWPVPLQDVELRRRDLACVAITPPVRPRREPVRYKGWRALRISLVGPDGAALPAHALLRCGDTGKDGIEAEVIDLGRGTPEEFAAHRDEIAGRIALVRHELMFAAGTIHRRAKLERSVEAGAVGVLISGPAPNHPVAGSAAVDGARSVPAAGISPATARTLGRTAAGRPRVRLIVETESFDAEADNLFFDLPAGDGDEWVVLSAHIDGHDIGESAIDNASGLAVCLETLRRVAPSRARWKRGLRVAFFDVEEWALTGSAQYVASLSREALDRIALNVNLDSVAGGAALTALTSGFEALEPFLLAVAKATGTDLKLFRPLQMNSDHGNFAQAGVPAFRLVAGFDDHSSAARHVLTPLDRREWVTDDELRRASLYSTACVEAALLADAADLRFRTR
jgi:DNA-binding transcriptional LysR family regulator